MFGRGRARPSPMHVRAHPEPRRARTEPATSIRGTTLGLLIQGFGAGQISLFLGVPAGKPRSGPPVGRDFRAAGAAGTPKIGDSGPAPKPCIRNPSVLKISRHEHELDRYGP